PRCEVNRQNEYKKTLIKQGASVGANATIVCGVTLGEYCFIAAGAVVTKDVPAFAMIAGVPGKVIGWMDRQGSKVESQPDN
ncbi:MAG: N-acetyltransferase, partial [Lentisphaeraceae bacterium]|nr:N-acetyltransferase [Lentisphaeraceae bacterium]